jgi:putative transposase
VLGTENQNLHYKAFYSDTAQQILTTVAESFKSYIGLLRRIGRGTVTQRPRLPNYRQGGLALVTYTGRSVRLKDGLSCRAFKLYIQGGQDAQPTRL